MIAKVEFNSFTRISDYVRKQPLLISSDRDSRTVEPTGTSGGSQSRPKSIKAQSFNMAELQVAS